MPIRELDHPGASPELGRLSDERGLAIVRKHLPPFWRDRPIAVEMRLDDAGIGLDSVDLLELLLACERDLEQQMPTDLLLDEAMTVGDFIRKLQAIAPAT